MSAVQQEPAVERLGERDGVRWWPALIGVVVAVVSGLGVDNGAGLAMIVAASGFIYVAAAAQGNPRAAWSWFGLSLVVITAGKVLDDEAAPLLAFLVLAVALMAWGVSQGRWPAVGGLRLQSAAMLGFGIAALIGFALNSAAGGLVVAAGLVAHAGWDVVHHRRNRVVVRSFAELCVVLDLVLAGMIGWAVLS